MKKRIMISLTEEDIQLLQFLSNGYNKSSTISEALYTLNKYRLEKMNRRIDQTAELVGNDI